VENDFFRGLDMTLPTEAIARRFLKAWNVEGEAIVDELGASDLVVSYTHFPEPLRGPQAFKQVLRSTHAYFPDLEITAEEVIATEDAAVVRWFYRATLRAGKLFGVEAAGQRVEVRGITIYHVVAGLVLREEGVVDNLSLMAQLQGHSAL
jgi:steroid delta-isomerase-like uncharacterized protein